MIVRRASLLPSAIAIAALAVAACGSAAPGASADPPASSSPAAVGGMASPPPPSAASSPSSSLAPSPAPFRVVGLTLTADPPDHVGACPVDIAFRATVTVTGGSGAVSYRWRSSDGATSPTKTVDVREGHPTTIPSTWTVDATSVPTHAGWSAIELVEPPTVAATEVDSARADFVFTCDTDNDVEAIGFGIGGSDADCSIARPLETFAPADRIRVVANWWPSLASGTTVTMRLARGDEVVDGYPVTIRLNESTKCLHGSVSPGDLPPGHYRLDVTPDTARAIAGEFDVK